MEVREQRHLYHVGGQGALFVILLSPLGLHRFLLQIRDMFCRADAVIGKIEVMLQRHRTLQFFDYLNLNLPHTLHPLGEVRDIRNRGTQTDEFDMLRREDEALFPDGATRDVVNIVDLVKNNVGDIVKPLNVIENCITEDLGSHQQHLCVRIQHHIACNDADFLSIFGIKIAVFLIAECLNRRGVDNPMVLLNTLFDSIFGDDSLPRARWRGDNHRVIPINRGNGILLKPIQLQPFVFHQNLLCVICLKIV